MISDKKDIELLKTHDKTSQGNFLPQKVCVTKWQESGSSFAYKEDFSNGNLQRRHVTKGIRHTGESQTLPTTAEGPGRFVLSLASPRTKRRCYLVVTKMARGRLLLWHGLLGIPRLKITGGLSPAGQYEVRNG